MSVIGSLSVSVSLNYYIIIPLLPLLFLMLLVRRFYLSTSVQIKRIEGISMKLETATYSTV